MLSIEDISSLENKVALVRVDFNVESPKDSLRIKKIIPTINLLLQKGAKVLLISHRGRPVPGDKINKDTTLKVIVSPLEKNLGQPVHFIPEFKIEEIKKTIQERDEKVFLLENLRLLVGEKENSDELAKQYASLADIYVNDAFAVCHRREASLVAITKFLPAYTGVLLLEEITNLDRAINSPNKPLVIVLGGGKAPEKFAVIKSLYNQVDKFLIGGVLGNTFLKASGMQVEDSVVDNSLIEEVTPYLKDEKIEISSDWIYDEHKRIYDIGPITITRFSMILKEAKTIIWSGPLGFFEDKRYREGSDKIANAISSNKNAFSLVGGGETTQLILENKMEDEFSFLSTGGGAMLSYLGKKEMPAINALNQ